MVTLCLIGSDPSVTVRPFWSAAGDPEPTTGFLAELSDWGKLSELQLAAEESAFKVARRRGSDGSDYTWIAFHRGAGAFGAPRPTTNMGIGFLLRDAEAVPGDVALRFLATSLQAFLLQFAPQGRLDRRISEITPELFPEPRVAATLRAAIYQRTQGSGLAVRAGKTAGGVLFFDLAGPDERDQIASYLDDCQSDDRFSTYHTLLVGDAPPASEKRLTKGVHVTAVGAFYDASAVEDAEPDAATPATVAVVDNALPGDRQQIAPAAAIPHHAPVMREYREPASTRRSSNPVAESYYYRGLAHALIAVLVIVLAFAAMGYRLTRESAQPPRTDYGITSPGDGATTVPPSSVDPESASAGTATAMPANDPVKVLGIYFGRLRQGKISEALDIWSEENRPAISPQQIADTLRHYRDFQATISPASQPRSVAGETQVAVPVTLTGKIDDAPFSVSGSIGMRIGEVNGKPRWLIYDMGTLATHEPVVLTQRQISY